VNFSVPVSRSVT